MASYSRELYSGKIPEDIPVLELDTLDDEITASYTGPDDGLAFPVREQNGNTGFNSVDVAGITDWRKKSEKGYGICISLYEQHPVNGKMSGDPIADAFAICARKNNCILLIADGVNWGEKSRLAARCALYGAMKYLNKHVYDKLNQPRNTREVVEILRNSFDQAHQTILSKDGGLTTMCACMICPMKGSKEFSVCCVNVGDSYGYILGERRGIREITVGSHDISSERDIRDAGGAIGPVHGSDPELQNLTCSMTFASEGDIVFLTTDGISDNFDPVVTKVAIPRQVNGESAQDISNSEVIIKPEMEPGERHIYGMKEMERVINEQELVTEEQCTAQSLCSTLVQHVLMLTDSKRKVLENPSLYKRRRMTQDQRQIRDSEIKKKMAKAPGKLDHASIVAYELGRTNHDNLENIPLTGSPLITKSPSSVTSTPDSNSSRRHSNHGLSGSKPSRPRKLFSRLRSLSVTSPQSPLSPTSLGKLSISPQKISFKRSRSGSEPNTPSSPGNGSFLPKGSSSPSPMSPQSPNKEIPIPLPAQHPKRTSVTYESAV
ncbi:PP2C-like domain-containing protein CG9801 [Mytilus edulis]|uniref:PP2C-like domain-containing protein CG9801 n=1 Tax=Mytilus edulis TaxID=6550 RepID=A0A8S3VAY0_MYTED|nr:PP2C-like domain-containing protein CG9801 [Mytilus edulis]